MDEVADNTKGRLLRSRKQFRNILDEIQKESAPCTGEALAVKETKKIQKATGGSKSRRGATVKKAMSRKRIAGKKDDIALSRKFIALCREKPHVVAQACSKYQGMTKSKLRSALRRNNANVTGSKDYLVMRAICMMRLRRAR